MSSEKSKSIVKHLGLILDGNRRWAKDNSLPTLEGHKKGYENLKDIAKYAFDQNIQYVTAYVFSTENWNRSADEVSYLMNLLIWVAKNEIKELDKNNIKVVFIGERDRLSKNVIKAMDDAMEKTKNNDGGTLILCLNYGGQQEIASAVNKILDQNPGITNITPEMITDNLYLPEVPMLDLIIRTSGEQRLSNFMTWRSIYSELYFTEKHWPAFTQDDLQIALNEFASRQRRYGK